MTNDNNTYSGTSKSSRPLATTSLSLLSTSLLCGIYLLYVSIDLGATMLPAMLVLASTAIAIVFLIAAYISNKGSTVQERDLASIWSSLAESCELVAHSLYLGTIFFYGFMALGATMLPAIATVVVIAAYIYKSNSGETQDEGDGNDDNASFNTTTELSELLVVNKNIRSANSDKDILSNNSDFQSNRNIRCNT